MERLTDKSYVERDMLDGIIREKQGLIVGESKTLLSLYRFITFGSPQASCPKCTTVSGWNYEYYVYNYIIFPTCSNLQKVAIRGILYSVDKAIN